MSRKAREKVRVKGIEILSAASLLSTDIFFYTQFGDTYKLQVENRDPRKLTSVRVFNIHCKPITPNFVLVSSQVTKHPNPVLGYHLRWERCYSILVFETHHDLTLLYEIKVTVSHSCLLYTSPSPRDLSTSRMPSSA